MNHRSTLLLEHHLKELKLPSFLREYGKLAAQCAAEGVDHPQYLLRLAELELIDRHQRMVERRIRVARFPRGQEHGHLRNCSDFVGSERSPKRRNWQSSYERPLPLNGYSERSPQL